MKRIHRALVVVLITISCAGCDQATKDVARRSLASAPPISLLNDSVRVAYSENPGAFLSLGANLPAEARHLFFVILVSALLVFTILFMIRTPGLSLVQLVGLSLVAAGGLGNLLDRLTNDGLVVDFLQIGVGQLRTGVFNVADVCIVGGISVFALFSLKAEARAIETQ